MKTPISLMFAAAALLAAGVATAQSPRGDGPLAKLDANGDGQIQIAEIEANAAKHAAELDADRDGFITTAEIAALREAKRAERAERHLLRMDADKDGVVSVDEFAAARSERAAKRDKNDDGVISADEMRGGKHRHGRRARTAGPDAG